LTSSRSNFWKPSRVEKIKEKSKKESLVYFILFSRFQTNYSRLNSKGLPQTQKNGQLPENCQNCLKTARKLPVRNGKTKTVHSILG
jgi:hypothetical protein